MKKLKPLEIKNHRLTRNNDSNISNILNKKSLNQTRTTDYSISPNISLNDIKQKINKKEINKKSKPLINNPNKKEEEKKLNKKNSQPSLNITTTNLPTNVNDFYHLIYDNLFGSCESLNWVLGLRLGANKNKKINYKNISEPSFYLADKNKFTEKISKENKPLLNEFNPDYSKIQHLTNGRNKGNINYSQFSFSSCLRNMRNKKNEIKEKERKFHLTPLPRIKGFEFKVKNLSPITTDGINNLSKVEKYIPKYYKINYENTKVGNDTIKKKILSINRSYTLCGFGDNLDEPKYNNKFREVNIFANRGLLSTTSNPTSKFELSLRNYSSNNISDKKYK